MRTKKVPEIQSGSVIIYKKVHTTWDRGYRILYVINRYTDPKKGSHRYSFLDIEIRANGHIWQNRYDYAETTFSQRIRGIGAQKHLEELDPDAAKLEVVVATGKTIVMMLREALDNSKSGINRRIEWYQKKIIQEQQKVAEIDAIKESINE